MNINQGRKKYFMRLYFSVKIVFLRKAENNVIKINKDTIA